MAHGEEYRLDTSGTRRVVQLGIAVGYVADAYESGLSLRLVDRFLEAVKSADTAEGKTFLQCKSVGCGQVFEETCRVPLSVELRYHLDWVLAFNSLYSRAWALSSVRAR